VGRRRTAQASSLIRNFPHVSAGHTAGGRGGGSSGYTFTIVAGVNLQACDTETIPANSITAGWNNGDFLTYTQAEWGSGGRGASTLTNNYNTVYASASDVFVIGDTSIYTEKFTSASALESYLPQTGRSAC
jgi:hypothetical protein